MAVDEYTIIRSARRWRMVLVVLGAAIIVVLVGGQALSRYALVVALTLVAASMWLINSKLTFSEDVRLRAEARFSLDAVTAAVQLRFPEARLTEQGGRITIRTRQSARFDVKVEPRAKPGSIRVTSVVPRWGELGMKPVRSRIHDWADVVRIVRREFGVELAG